MTKNEMESLRIGDQVKANFVDEVWIVTGNYGGRITAVQSIDMTNPVEWELISRVITRGYKEER